MKKLRYYLFLVLAIAFVSSCDNTRVFEDYSALSEEGWHKDSLVVFNFQISDTLKNHNLYVNVRNGIDYKYSNLWLFIGIKQPGEVAIKDTFGIVLADPTGKWLGEGFGGIKEKQVDFKRNVYFPVSGEYEITIQQGMRVERLLEIKDIGVRVEKVQ